MCERVLILYRHPLFAEAVRRLLSVDADLELHTAPLVNAAATEAIEHVRPGVLVVERSHGEDAELALPELVSRVPRIVSLGLEDNSLICVEGESLDFAGPDELRRAVRPRTAGDAEAASAAARSRVVSSWDVRWLGRGGQGAVTAAKWLAGAAIRDGRHAQAFPEYGPERRGAPLIAFTRLADRPIQLYTPVEQADVVVLLDPTLIGQIALLDGLKPGGLLLANWPASPEQLRAALGTRAHCLATVDATAIGRELLGQPIPNTALLGALVHLTPLVSWPALEAELRAAFGERDAAHSEANIGAARRGFEVVQTLPADPAAVIPPPTPVLELAGWRALSPGGVTRPVAARAAPPTGTWRSQRPVLDLKRCIHCMFCWVFCPDSAILVQNGRVIGVDYDHCKGCGICSRECPVKPTAVHMVDEQTRFAGEPQALTA